MVFSFVFGVLMGWMEGKFFFCGDCILWKEILFSFGTGEGWLYGRECFYSHSVGMRSALGSLVCVFKESSPRSLSSSFRLDRPFRITPCAVKSLAGTYKELLSPLSSLEKCMYLPRRIANSLPNPSRLPPFDR